MKIRYAAIFTVIVLFVIAGVGQETANEKASKPVSYGIVVDNSGSYRLLLERIINFTTAVAEKNTDQDEAFLVTFVDQSKTKVRTEFTSDKNELLEAVGNMYVEGGSSAVLDASRLAIDYIVANSKDRKGRVTSLLLISDGDDRASIAKLESVVTVAKENNIKIVVVGISDEKVNTKLLDRLAKGTGGAAFFPKTPKETMASVSDVAAALRAN
jgi:Ca-activated chloride channel family protein